MNDDHKEPTWHERISDSINGWFSLKLYPFSRWINKINWNFDHRKKRHRCTHCKTILLDENGWYITASYITLCRDCITNPWIAKDSNSF